MGFHIKVGELSCYCAGCKTAEQCLNSDCVDLWCVKVFRPTEQQQPEEHPPAQPQMEDHLLQQREAVSLEESTEDNSTQTVSSFAAFKFETKNSQVCYMYFAKVKAIDTDDICVEYLEKCTGRGSEFAWHASSPKFDPHVQHILSWRLGLENISTAILPLLLIQEEQLSVTGERMCTKYW